MPIGLTNSPGRNKSTRRMVKRRQDKMRSLTPKGAGITEYDGGPVYNPAQAQEIATTGVVPDPNSPSNVPGGPQAYSQTSATSTAPAGGGGFPSGATPTGADRTANDYYWNDPNWAMAKYFTDAFGGSPNINNSFYNAMLEQAPGLKFMQLFGKGNADPFNASMGLVDTMGQYVNGSAGGWDALSNAGNVLFGGGASNPAMKGYIDSLDPRQAVQMLSSMIGTSAFGTMGPELASGLVNQLQQSYSNFGAIAPSLMTDPLQSDMAAFAKYMATNADDIFGFLGF